MLDTIYRSTNYNADSDQILLSLVVQIVKSQNFFIVQSNASATKGN